jgi:phosphomannomutase
MDVKCSQETFNTIKKLGGSPEFCRTGHSFIKRLIKEKKAQLAGELSGHIYFYDEYNGQDDAIYAAIRTLRIMEEPNFSLCDFVDALPQTFRTPEMHVPCSRKHERVEKLKQYILEQNRSFWDIDGVRCLMDEGWWLIRPSNTEDILVVCGESNTSEGLKEIKKDLDFFIGRTLSF